MVMDQGEGLRGRRRSQMWGHVKAELTGAEDVTPRILSFISFLNFTLIY